jgi:hypothetical protein
VCGRGRDALSLSVFFHGERTHSNASRGFLAQVLAAADVCAARLFALKFSSLAKPIFLICRRNTISSPRCTLAQMKMKGISSLSGVCSLALARSPPAPYYFRPVSLALTLNLSRMLALHVRQLTFIRERQPLCSQRKRKPAFLKRSISFSGIGYLFLRSSAAKL